MSADAADAGRMLLMLVVSWPRCATCLSVYVWRKVGMLGQNLLHMSQSLSGKELICWIKTALIDMLDQNCSRSAVLCNFLSAAMRACSCSFVTMAASVSSKLKLGISECRCVASPAPARAFVPARGSQVELSSRDHIKPRQKSNWI